MTKWKVSCIAFTAVAASWVAFGHEGSVVKPQLLLRETVQTMPRSQRQEVRVLSVNFQPGDRTPFHTHRHPVTIYVLEGAFTMEMEGREPVRVKAGEAMMMPPQVKMTGFNRSGKDPLRLVAFYVSDPDTPFLDPVQ